MAKKYLWEVEEIGEQEEKILHSISLECCNLTGKAIITIDGDKYDISVRPLKLRGTSQVFRLGSLAAVIEFPKKGSPRVTVGTEVIPAK